MNGLSFIMVWLLFLWAGVSGFTQMVFPQSIEDSHFQEMVVKTSESLDSRHGKVLTPKGDLRVLIVCVGFGEKYDTLPMPGWSAGANTFPDWVNAKTSFYSSSDDFLRPAAGNDKKNISRFYYEMSLGKFRLTADVYPRRIDIDATGANSFGVLNKRVLEKMKADDPGFDWSKYDGRKSRLSDPPFSSDISGLSPDTIPDFIVIVYRYKNDKTGVWYTNAPVLDDPATPLTNEHISGWFGSTGGFASLDIFKGYAMDIDYNGYTFFTANGYTQCLGAMDFYEMFIHEMAHVIFDCPHYGDKNGVVGEYFYNQLAGWGMMNLGYGPFGCANGWERWYLGWSDLKANGVHSDVKSSGCLPLDGEFTLRDFITTGDVVRIKVRNDGGIQQYLWLENHQGKSIYDNRGWVGNGCGEQLPPSARGLIGYIESISDSLTNPFSFTDSLTANGIKPLHSKGNYDFSWSGPAERSCVLFNNPIINIIEGMPNPISGQSRIEGIRADFDLNDTITINENLNTLNPKNENHWVVKRNGTMTYDMFGSDINFEVGQKIGMATNPPLVNRPVYSFEKHRMSPVYLNGISVLVDSQAPNGDIKIKVSYKKVGIESDIRWSGEIMLTNITKNSDPDLDLYPSCTITLNKSGTPNRGIKTSYNEFVNPTILNCEKGSYVRMQSKSRVIVDDLSLLKLSAGSIFEINDGAVLVIKKGGTLRVESGVKLILKDSGSLIIEEGAYLCINPDVVIDIRQESGSVYLNHGLIYGRNPFFRLYLNDNLRTSDCSVSFKSSGAGYIYTDKFIQNEILTGTQHFKGFIKISAGSDVTTEMPAGPVIIPDGAHIRFEAKDTVLMDKGFEVQLGGTLEVK